MRQVAVFNRTRGTMLGTRIAVADRWWSRLRGLIGRPRPAQGEGMMLMRCRGVHLYGLRYPLDVALVDRRGTVIALYPGLRPGTRTRWHRRAAHVLELPAGTLDGTGTREGDSLEWGVAAGTVEPAAAGTD